MSSWLEKGSPYNKRSKWSSPHLVHVSLRESLSACVSDGVGSHYKTTGHKVQQMTNWPQSAIAGRSVGTIVCNLNDHMRTFWLFLGLWATGYTQQREIWLGTSKGTLIKIQEEPII